MQDLIIVAGALYDSVDCALPTTTARNRRLAERAHARGGVRGPDTRLEGSHPRARRPRARLREALPTEGVKYLLVGDRNTGKGVLRDYVNKVTSDSPGSPRRAP